MSPAPVQNDPGKDGNEENQSPYNVIADVPPALPDSSDGDSADEIVHDNPAGDIVGPNELMGYQLLPQGYEPIGHELIESDDESEGDDNTVSEDVLRTVDDLNADCPAELDDDGYAAMESTDATVTVQGVGYEAMLPKHLQASIDCF